MRLKQLSKHFCHSDWDISNTCILNASTLLQVLKNVDLSFYFLRTRIKRSHCVPKQDYTTDDSLNRIQNAVVWADVWEPALSWWRVIHLLRLVFLISWKTTGKQMIAYHLELTVLRCSSGTIATCQVFPKKQAIICLEALRARATFGPRSYNWSISFY